MWPHYRPHELPRMAKRIKRMETTRLLTSSDPAGDRLQEFLSGQIDLSRTAVDHIFKFAGSRQQDPSKSSRRDPELGNRSSAISHYCKVITMPEGV